MAYAIIRLEKLKTMASVKNRLEHNYRDKPVLNADITIKNTRLRGQPQDSQEALNLFTQRLSQVKKPRKDSVLGLEYLMTSGPEFFEGKTQEEIERWANSSLNFLIKKHKRENVISAVLHLDEKTPHLQVIVIPAVEKIRPKTKTRPERKEIALCAKEFTGGRHILAKLWTDYYHYVKKYGLERGQINSYTTHETARQFYAKAKEYKRNEPLIKHLRENLRELQSKTTAARYALQKIHTELYVTEKINEQLKKAIEIWKEREKKRIEAEHELKKQEQKDELKEEADQAREKMNMMISSWNTLQDQELQRLKTREEELEKKEQELEAKREKLENYERIQRAFNHLPAKQGINTPEEYMEEELKSYRRSRNMNQGRGKS